jgi:methylmalonyl-CoA/ethylmalonyl-CoA epimerase
LSHQGFTVRGVNHIGLAAKDPARAKWFFETALGLAPLGEELVQEQQVTTVMLGSSDTGETPVTPPRLEILIPEPAGAGPIGKYLETRGSGIHHVALAVTGLEALLARLKTLGVRLIDETPRRGAHKTRIAFVHPASAGGLLVELVEEVGA